MLNLVLALNHRSDRYVGSAELASFPAKLADTPYRKM